MKYGNPALHFNNPSNPNARRKEGMGLKKAQPGAPYGRPRTGEPYCGTQYEVDIDGKRWNSLSTRDGHRDNWRTFASVTTKVAQSAYEHYGSYEPVLHPGMESGVRARVLQKLHQLYTPPETTTAAATATAPAPVKAEPSEVATAAVAPVTAAAAKRAKKARAKDEAAPATAAGEKQPRKKAKGEASVKLEGAMDEIAAAVLEGAAKAAPKEEEAAAAPVKEEVVA